MNDITGHSFPDDFRWGTATAAHQIEGGNWNNDWWEWEHRENSVVADRGGWREAETAGRFAEFCASAAGDLGDVIRVACTINEPNVVFVDAHRQAVQAVRSAAPDVPVGLTLSMTDYQAVDGGEATRDETRALVEDPFLAATDGDDFVGVQTYSRARCGPGGLLGAEEGVEVLDMGYEYWPRSLAATIRRAWEVTGGAVPIRVTENGIGTTDDDQRIRYLRTALTGVLDCIDEGIDVTGYTCWSLLDNFEWAFGYGPTSVCTRSSAPHRSPVPRRAAPAGTPT